MQCGNASPLDQARKEANIDASETPSLCRILTDGGEGAAAWVATSSFGIDVSETPSLCSILTHGPQEPLASSSQNVTKDESWLKTQDVNPSLGLKDGGQRHQVSCFAT